jgi:hypothetical protein
VQLEAEVERQLQVIIGERIIDGGQQFGRLIGRVGLEP